LWSVLAISKDVPRTYQRKCKMENVAVGECMNEWRRERFRVESELNFILNRNDNNRWRRMMDRLGTNRKSPRKTVDKLMESSGVVVGGVSGHTAFHVGNA
ncbi:hypothetical protein T06_5870, partial [Trichinella sp. T6]